MVMVIFGIGWLIGMYGLYKVKHGYKIKGWLITFLGVALCLSMVNAFSGDSSKKENAENSQQVVQEESSIEWYTDFSNPESVVKNTELCVKAMNEISKNGRVADRAKKVRASDIINNPSEYLGQFVEIGITVTEVENAPEGSGITKSYGKSCHLVVGTASDDAMVMEIRKGTQPKVTANDFTVAVGMPAGVIDMGNNQKSVMIVGIP